MLPPSKADLAGLDWYCIEVLLLVVAWPACHMLLVRRRGGLEVLLLVVAWPGCHMLLVRGGGGVEVFLLVVVFGRAHL